MPCNQEQYETHLKEALLGMGYVEDSISHDWHKCGYIVNNYPDKVGRISNVVEIANDLYGRTFIPTFNPQKFLAIAAMTEGEIPIIGEWMRCKTFNSGRFIHNKLYKVERDFDGQRPFTDECGRENGYSNRESHLVNFTKATVEEILESKQENLCWTAATIEKKDTDETLSVGKRWYQHIGRIKRVRGIREEKIEHALRCLIELYDYKQEKGKTELYNAVKESIWKQAKEILNEK